MAAAASVRLSRSTNSAVCSKTGSSKFGKHDNRVNGGGAKINKQPAQTKTSLKQTGGQRAPNENAPSSVVTTRISAAADDRNQTAEPPHAAATNSHLLSPSSQRCSTGTGSESDPPVHQQQQTRRSSVVGETGLYAGGNLRLVDTIDGPSHVMCVRFSPDGNFVATGFADGTIKLYEVQTCQCVNTLIADDAFGSDRYQPVTCLHFGLANKLLATYASGAVKLWQPTMSSSPSSSSSPRPAGFPAAAAAAEYRAAAWSVDECRHTLAAAFNPHGSKLVTTGSTPQIHLYDVETGRRLATMEAREHRGIMDGHRERVFAVQYHASQPNLFLTGGWDDTVQYWDDRQPQAIRNFYGPHICGDALDIDSVHGQILTGSWRTGSSTLQIWDFASAAKIRDVPNDRLLGHSRLYCAQWLGSDQILCGGSERNLARTVSRSALATVGHVTNLANGVYAADSAGRPDGPNAAASASTSGIGGGGRPPRLVLASGSSVHLIRYSTLVHASASTPAAAHHGSLPTSLSK